jgi:2-methylisocitrate lyase-like PEP mutase family enzyme
MRTIAFLIVLAQLVTLGPLYFMYGQLDPCRALAAEIASRAKAAGGLGTAIENTFGDLEINARREIADRSTGQCLSNIIGSWGGRAIGK